MEGLHGYPKLSPSRNFLSGFKLSGYIENNRLSEVAVFVFLSHYKLAKVILTDEAVSLCNESIAFWTSRYPFDDRLSPEIYKYANQALVTCEVSKAGLLGRG